MCSGVDVHLIFKETVLIRYWVTSRPWSLLDSLIGCDDTSAIPFDYKHFFIAGKAKHCLSIFVSHYDSLLLCQPRLPSSTPTLWLGEHTQGRSYYGTTEATKERLSRGLPCQRQHIRYSIMNWLSRPVLCVQFSRVKWLPHCLCSTQFTVWM